MSMIDEVLGSHFRDYTRLYQLHCSLDLGVYQTGQLAKMIYDRILHGPDEDALQEAAAGLSGIIALLGSLNASLDTLERLSHEQEREHRDAA